MAYGIGPSNTFSMLETDNYNEEQDNIKIQNFLIEKYLELLNIYPYDTDLVISFIHYLNGHTSYFNCVRYELEKLEYLPRTLSQQKSFLILKSLISSQMDKEIQGGSSKQSYLEGF